MTLIQGLGCFCWERLSVVFPNSFLPSKSEFFKQSARPPGHSTTTDVPKYTKNDFHQIFNTVLEA